MRQRRAILLIGVILTVGFSVVGGVAGTAQAQAGAGPTDVDTNDLSGDGSPSNPYEISNASELQAMEDDPTANYELVSDIDASNTAQFNDGSGFDPVGGFDNEFIGSFDGNGHTITGLTIERPEEDNVGLFDENSGIVIDVTLMELTVAGDEGVGGLAGDNVDGTIRNATVSGKINGTRNVGGLVGFNEGGTIQNATASGSVIKTGEFVFGPAGGLVGRNDGGTILDASASGSVTGENEVGGLVGLNDGGAIRDVTATGSVTGERRVGGLVGINRDGTVQNATATGNVTGTGEENVGGLIGDNNRFGTIRNVTASGSVSGTRNVGGLVGRNEGGTIRDVTASGSVSGTEVVGGLVGDNSNFAGTIRNATASGSVSGTNNVGGLVGEHGGTMQNATASGDVTGTTDVGGLVGVNSGEITDTFAVGPVTVTFEQLSVGGLVGTNDDGTVEQSYFDTQTTGQDSSAGSATGLTTAEMQGSAATESMDLAFGESWQTVSGDYPALIALSDGETGSGSDSEPDTVTVGGQTVPTEFTTETSSGDRTVTADNAVSAINTFIGGDVSADVAVNVINAFIASS